jgi:hypothetical protein
MHLHARFVHATTSHALHACAPPLVLPLHATRTRCGACRAFAPLYDKVGASLEGRLLPPAPGASPKDHIVFDGPASIFVARIDCAHYPGVCNGFKVSW